MTRAELLTLKNYVEAGNVLTIDMALRLIGSLTVAQQALDNAPKQEPQDNTTPLRRAVQEWFLDIAPNETAALLGPSEGDALDAAIVGIADLSPRENVTVFVYDADKSISILATENEMTHEDAEEYFSFNTAGTYLGPTTPIFVRRFPQPE